MVDRSVRSRVRPGVRNPGADTKTHARTNREICQLTEHDIKRTSTLSGVNIAILAGFTRYQEEPGNE
ncbi:hypothetical protein QUB60_22070 [Microcoleus sp. A2-C5]|uniref:hypothetical protein n=1 Tax=unclassified Microcoleus TaxID=2642155 RepID=UPI002FD72B81